MIAASGDHLDHFVEGRPGLSLNKFHNIAHHGSRIGVLGISLGAQIASAASVGRADIEALVLVDGGLPNGYPQPVRSLPPLLLFWGSADQTFPLSIGRELQRTAQQLGGPVTLDVYEGGAHDFFLRSGTGNAGAARRSAERDRVPGVEFVAIVLTADRAEATQHAG